MGGGRPDSQLKSAHPEAYLLVTRSTGLFVGFLHHPRQRQTGMLLSLVVRAVGRHRNRRAAEVQKRAQAKTMESEYGRHHHDLKSAVEL